MVSNNDDVDQIRADINRIHDGLVAAIRAAWDHCETYYDAEHGIGVGGNLPELIRGALEVVAADLGGGTGVLVKHRPGSWEADLIRHLAGMADLVE